jgi:hypothetical protein
MTCKHRWEPSNFGIKHRTPDNQLFECHRCHQVISTLKMTDMRQQEKLEWARHEIQGAVSDLREAGKVI